MPTPYEEISENYSNREAVKTDANLAQDTLQLGGLDAEDWATKVFVNQKDANNSIRDQAYADRKAQEALNVAKAYSDAGIRNIDFTPFATNASLNATKNNLKQEMSDDKNNLQGQINTTNSIMNQIKNNLQGQINTSGSNIAALAAECNQKYNELFQSVSSGKSKIAEAITDKGVATSASDTFQTMANKIGQITTGGRNRY